LLVVLGAWGGCKRNAASAATAPATPTLRVYAISTLAGALEPCGCVKDMLGGVDHAAALVRSGKSAAGGSLVLGAGPIFFMDPELEAERRTQDIWKAEAIAASLKDVGAVAWAPGLNDWAAGAPELGRLAKTAGATGRAQSARVVDAGGLKVGIAGVSLPSQSGRSPDGVKVNDARAALERASKLLGERGAEVKIALVAAARGDALRLAENTPGFQLVIVGKPYDQGEGNDGRTPPVLIGDTLVVQSPNHLQGVAIIDLFVRDRSFVFQDGSGVRHAERRASLERRIAELEKRIGEWQAQVGTIKQADLDARREDLGRLKRELAELEQPSVPERGSYFRYEHADVVEHLGSDTAVASRLSAYYRRVNEHNKQAFADRKPPPVPEGKSGYIGVEKCTACHAEERKFWDGTPHARAYVTLDRQHKQFNLDCVSCHVTGYEKPGGSTVTHVADLKHVQCETCHGPGSRHVSDPSNAELIVKKPSRSLCAPECHHPPHVKDDWSVDRAWKLIVGPGHGG
jgi:hypothetical protein